MKTLKMMTMALLLLGSFTVRAESVEQRLKKIDACLDAVFQQGEEKHGKKGFEKILVAADDKTNMFEDEEHCFVEKPGEDLKCQARVLTAALKVLIPDMKLESLRAKGQVCEGF